jgi:hypothetical protein
MQRSVAKSCRGHSLGLALILGLMLLAGLDQQAFASTASARSNIQVVLFRGFMNVFSLGLDDVAARIRANGIQADVHNHSEVEAVVPKIAERYRSGKATQIVLIGHSLGVPAVIEAIELLDRMNVPVALAFTLDHGPHTISSGRVGHLTNLFIRGGSMGGPLQAGPNFRGRLTNVELSERHPEVTHMNIDSYPYVHNLLLRQILASSSQRPSAPSARNTSAKKRGNE